MWERIEDLLKKRNISQKELANKMKVSPSTISEIKSGVIKRPSFKLVCKIADALDVTVDDLRTDRKEDKSFEKI
ncbi:helix-turn-helix domain-containing protein [Enterococcus sp. AZ103]|uniref:helix-turn-helix domain-containing protein n=1 Tax=Enterococcus sp. AZ103 TaxID=2774628 RepID=UPI003F1F4AA8